LNVAVIGVGGWGKNHLRVYSQLRRLCTLKALCDLDEGRARSYGEMYKVPWYTDVTTLLEKADVDVVNICTPPSTHHPIALAAIEAGKHLLVEKPLALTPSQALGIHRAARRKGLKLTVGFIERFNSGVLRLKKLVDSKGLGSILFVSATRIAPWRSVMGNLGIIMDTAIHDVDTIRFLLGRDPHGVYAGVSNLVEEHTKGLETRAEIFLKFKGDLSAYLIAEWLKPSGERVNKIRQLQVTGSEGVAILSYIPQLVWKMKAVDVLTPFVSKDGRPKYSCDPKEVMLMEPVVWKEPLALELKSFLQSIINGEEPRVSGEDGVRAVEIVQAAMRSAEIDRPQTIPYRDL